MKCVYAMFMRALISVWNYTLNWAAYAIIYKNNMLYLSKQFTFYSYHYIVNLIHH